MIRVPAEFEDQLLAIAHRLDDGYSDSESNLSLDELEKAIAAVVMSIRPGDRRAANLLFKKLLARLKT